MSKLVPSCRNAHMNRIITTIVLTQYSVRATGNDQDLVVKVSSILCCAHMH